MTTSRETARDALVTLLDTALVPAEVTSVTGYRTALGADTPLVWVLSAGSDREPLTFKGHRLICHLDVYVWVSETLSRGPWASPNAVDHLDTVEKIIAETLLANVRTANWDTIGYSDRTFVDLVKNTPDDLNAYYREWIPVIVWLAHN